MIGRVYNRKLFSEIFQMTSVSAFYSRLLTLFAQLSFAGKQWLYMFVTWREKVTTANQLQFSIENMKSFCCLKYKAICYWLLYVRPQGFMFASWRHEDTPFAFLLLHVCFDWVILSAISLLRWLQTTPKLTLLWKMYSEMFWTVILK